MRTKSELWKVFGCGTDVGRTLRKLYNSKAGISATNAKIRYPKVKLESKSGPAGGPVAQVMPPPPGRPRVAVPRVGCGGGCSQNDDGLSIVMPPVASSVFTGKRSSQTIDSMVATSAEVFKGGLGRPGRDNDLAKDRLADSNWMRPSRTHGTRCLPEAALAPAVAVPFLTATNKVSRAADSGGNMAAAEETLREIKDMQCRLDEVAMQVAHMEAQNAHMIEAAQTRGGGARGKAYVRVRTEMLQLRNDIDRKLRDLDLLLDDSSNDH